MPSAISVAAAETVDPERARFHANLVNGLHAMAQPLTILRSAMEILTLPNPGTIDQPRYVQISARQVALTCGMFTCLQDLVQTQLIEARRERFDLWDLVRPLIDDQRRMLEPAGVGIAVGAEPRTTIWGDANRTENALARVLKLAGSLSGRGDAIHVYAMKTGGRVELTCENTSRHGKALESSDRLSLAVAEANILSQSGCCAVVEDPFRVSLALPIENPGAAVHEAKPSCIRPQAVAMN